MNESRSQSRFSPLACSFLLLTLSACATVPAGDEAMTQRFTTSDGVAFQVEVVAKNLFVPWSIAFDPDGRLFLTERNGRVRLIVDGTLQPEPILTIGDVEATGEGGLMGLALDPSFSETRFIYLAYTYRGSGGLANRVVRYREQDGRLVGPTIILDALPGSFVHDGCRLRFGPDGKLYITTGDSAQRDLAQRMESPAGKILRLNPDGTIPSDNPFPNSPVFSLGHRNPQGIDWHPVTKIALNTEHGPSGFDGPGGGDEVNLVEAGKNYGWPVIHHQETRAGMVSPLLEFTPAVAPSGGSFYRGTLFPSFTNNFFFATLRGSHLHRVVFGAPGYRTVAMHEALLNGVFGRLRDVVEGPDGSIYFCTSNRDGRGSPHPDDDRILRIVPVP